LTFLSRLQQGFDGYLKAPATGGAHKKKYEVTDQDRLFSSSSLTYGKVRLLFPLCSGAWWGEEILHEHPGPPNDLGRLVSYSVLELPQFRASVATDSASPSTPQPLSAPRVCSDFAADNLPTLSPPSQSLDLKGIER
jgi:hypothetical protein